MFRQMRNQFVVAALTFGLIIAVAALAASNPIDDTGDGITGPGGIDMLSATSDGTNIEVVLTLNAAPANGFKYRVHFDYTAGLATSADRNDDGVEDGSDFCFTTSDDTMKLSVRRGNMKETGPGDISVNGAVVTYTVSYAELGLNPNDEVLIWADSHNKGIRDRAPDTDDLDDCAKPESVDEVLELTLS